MIYTIKNLYNDSSLFDLTNLAHNNDQSVENLNGRGWYKLIYLKTLSIPSQPPQGLHLYFQIKIVALNAPELAVLIQSGPLDLDLNA